MKHIRQTKLYVYFVKINSSLFYHVCVVYLQNNMHWGSTGLQSGVSSGPEQCDIVSSIIYCMLLDV